MLFFSEQKRVQNLHRMARESRSDLYLFPGSGLVLGHESSLMGLLGRQSILTKKNEVMINFFFRFNVRYT